MDKGLEKKIKERAMALLEKGRGGDSQHTLRCIDYARHLLRSERGDEEVVIPSLYLHDIGWSRVDWSDFKNAPPAQKKDAKSVRLHMQLGAEMAADILDGIGFDPDKAKKIIAVIAVHDDPEKAFSLNDPSAVLVVEADRLDRYGPDSFERYRQMFGREALSGDGFNQARSLRISGLTEWFKTDTAKILAEKLGKESGWLDVDH